jgi:hypothetical protein
MRNNMDAKSLAKVKSAGLRVIRRYEHLKTIKELRVQKSTCIPHGTDPDFIPENLSWQKLEGPFESKAAMNRKMNELLSMQMVVEG